MPSTSTLNRFGTCLSQLRHTKCRHWSINVQQNNRPSYKHITSRCTPCLPKYQHRKAKIILYTTFYNHQKRLDTFNRRTGNAFLSILTKQMHTCYGDKSSPLIRGTLVTREDYSLEAGLKSSEANETITFPNTSRFSTVLKPKFVYKKNHAWVWFIIHNDIVEDLMLGDNRKKKRLFINFCMIPELHASSQTLFTHDAHWLLYT